MGGLNEGCISNKGQVIGVIHRKFKVDHLEDDRIQRMIVTDGDDLTERKDQLFTHSDCFIILPGGVGTFEEFWYGVSCKGLSMKDMAVKPMVLVNMDGYYNGFLQQMERAKEEGILYHDLQHFFHVVDNVEDALAYCETEVKKIQSMSPDDRLKKGLVADDRKVSRDISNSKNPSLSMNNSCKYDVSLCMVSIVAIFSIGVFVGLRLGKN